MFVYWPVESIVRTSDQSDSGLSGFGPLIGNGIKVGFHAASVKREEETVLASVPEAGLMTVVPAGLRHVANGLRQAIERLPAPMTWVAWRERRPTHVFFAAALRAAAHDPRRPTPMRV